MHKKELWCILCFTTKEYNEMSRSKKQNWQKLLWRYEDTRMRSIVVSFVDVEILGIENHKALCVEFKLRIPNLFSWNISLSYLLVSFLFFHFFPSVDFTIYSRIYREKSMEKLYEYKFTQMTSVSNLVLPEILFFFLFFSIWSSIWYNIIYRSWIFGWINGYTWIELLIIKIKSWEYLSWFSLFIIQIHNMKKQIKNNI